MMPMRYLRQWNYVHYHPMMMRMSATVHSFVVADADAVSRENDNAGGGMRNGEYCTNDDVYRL